MTGRNTNSDILGSIDQYNVKSIYGFSYTFSPLYGGRKFWKEHAIPKETIEELHRRDVGFDLTLSSHIYSDEAYEQTLEMLERHHRVGNTVTVVNNTLARKLRTDFPKYRLKASCIRDPRTLDRLYKDIELFDEVVLDPNMLRDFDFIQSIPYEIRDNIVLFGSTGCMFNCSNKTCFPTISKDYAKSTMSVTDGCIKNRHGFKSPFYWWDYENSPLYEGFNRIKLELPMAHQMPIRFPTDWGTKKVIPLVAA